MTKDIDLLSPNKSVDTKSFNTNKNDSTKKEGLSLFDSLVMNNNKKEVESEPTKSSTKNSENVTSLKSSENINSIKNPEESKENKLTFKQSSETKESKVEKVDSENNKKIEVKNQNNEIKNSEVNKTVDTKDINNTKTSSLLDRMILEANKQTKTLSTSEKTLVNNDKNLNKSDNAGVHNNKASSLLDKLVNEAKTVIKNEEKENKQDNVTQNKKGKIDSVKNTEVSVPDLKEDKKDDKKSTVTKVKKEEDSVLIKELKKDIKEENFSELKEVKKDNKEENSSDVKELKKETAAIPSDKNIKTENIIDSKKIKTTDLKNENINRADKSVNENNPPEVLKEHNKSKENELKEVSPKQIKTNTDNLDKNGTNLKSNINPDSKISQETTVDYKALKDIPKSIENATLINSTKKVKNETVANELSKINSKSTEPDTKVDININKKELLSSSKEESAPKSEQTSKSLMDRLLDNAKDSTLAQKSMLPNENIKTQISNTKSNDVVTNIFLSNQKNSIYNQMLSTKSEGIKVVKEAKNVSDVKKSAEILDLGLKKTSVDIETPIENNKSKNILEKESLIDKLAFSRNIRRDENIIASSSSQINTTTNTSSSEVVTTLNVSPSLALSIQNRIVGAQQHMSAMMSEAARNMYQNYKPPVTAFRINLFPSQLGTIAILMKNDKENSISISLNMSSSSTLDAFVDNQAALKDALSKNFNNSQTNFTLDFNMQDQGQNQSSDNQEESKKDENVSSADVLESINENKDVGENLNYL